MDSSQYNPSYGMWNVPYSPHPIPAPLHPPPPPPPPLPPHQCHPESPIVYGRSSQSGGQHQDYHHYSCGQDLTPKPMVNQPSSYYYQHPPPPPPLPQQHYSPLVPQQHPQYVPQHVSYESQRILQPSSSVSCTESRDIAQSDWVGFKENRHDSWTMDAGQGRIDAGQGRIDTGQGRIDAGQGRIDAGHGRIDAGHGRIDAGHGRIEAGQRRSDTGRSRVDPGPGRNCQYDYSRSSRDPSGSSRSRDEFHSVEYVRKESRAVRTDGNYQDRCQLKSDTDRRFRGLDERNRDLSSSVGYGSDQYGVTVSRNMTKSSASHEGARKRRWDEAHIRGRTIHPGKKSNYYHFELGKYSGRGGREQSNKSIRTPAKQTQKKSALLRLETPRSHQKVRENDLSRHHNHYRGNYLESNSFRGKEHLGHSDRGLVEKQRGRTPVDLDVSFKSNVMVAKPVVSPTTADIHLGLSVTPKSSKAIRSLVVADKNEKALVIEGNEKLRTHFSDGASVYEGSRESTRQTTASEIEKKPDNQSSPSSIDAGGKLNDVRFVDCVIHDTKAKITDTGPEASTNDSEAKVCTTVHVVDNISSFCEALKEAKDDTNVEDDSNMEVCSNEEDVIDGDKSILKSHEDVLDRNGTGGNAGETHISKVMEKEEIVKTKTKVNTTPAKLQVSWQTAADLSGCSEADIHFAGKSICSVRSQPCEDVNMDCIPSSNLPMTEVNTGFKERKSIGLSIGSSDYGDKVFETSTLDASIYYNSEDLGDQLLAKSDICGIEDDNMGINKDLDSLSPENDTSTGHPKGLVSSTSLDIANISVDLANINNNVSEDLANANSFTVGTYTNTMVNSPDPSVIFHVESKNLPHCGNTINSSVENISRKESTKTTPAEMTDNLDGDESKQACVNNTSSSLTKVAVKGSSNVLPVERTDSCSRSDVDTEQYISVSPCYFSPLVAVSDQIQDNTSIKANYSCSQGGMMHEENNCAENMEVDTQEDKTKPSGGTLKNRSPETDIVVVSGDSVFPCDSLSSSPRLSFKQIQSEIHVAAMVDETDKVKEIQKEDIPLDTSEEQIMISHEVTQPSISLAHYPCLGKTSSGGDLFEPNGDQIEKFTDVTSDVGSQEKYSPNSADIFNSQALASDEKVHGTEILGDSGVRLPGSNSRAVVKFELAHVKDHVVSVPHLDSKSKSTLSSRYEIEKGKKKANYSTQKSYSRSLPFVSDTKKVVNPPTHITKRHTWHRKSDTSASPFVAAKPSPLTLSAKQKFPIVTAQSSSGYIRKRNSLVRKLSNVDPGVALEMPPSANKLNCYTAGGNITGSASMVDVNNTSFLVKTGEIPTLKRQSKPPSDSSTSKVSNAIATSSGRCVLSNSMDHLTTGLPESIMDSATSGAYAPHSGGDTCKTYDTLIQTAYASDGQQNRNPLKFDSSNSKSVVYVKSKANQLVAASDIHGASKSPSPPSDGYFKQSKNQLVRNSESRVNHSPDDSLDSGAAVMRPYKQSKLSQVWRQNDPRSGMPKRQMRYQRILPQLVPWKRVTYWRRLMNSVSASRHGSFPNISQKLSMMGKRHTGYTRSTNGYSLRKSRAFSFSGSHKLSKSIERDSRKANEEATLAAAAFAKKVSEKYSGQSNSRTTSRNHPARERVFRFGSLRYKMDSSRRTLQRISDEDGEGSKSPVIPKRLVIDNEEYVRVGNGNQLVRDPKKRTRVLANEKVRWSLHNVRLRRAKKKYCQFFTRFGKCNKEDGKCPYVHDPSKIAVCTKFLNGLCSNANCKLTHQVIPERMPDCSYFLQGLCNNEACPYRHVHVNPSAAICDGFLKGYCSDGDECRKKHSYTCPDFEATGSCSQGSKCKLHHPQNQGKGRKRKRVSEPSQRKVRGRYFDSLHKDLSESEAMVLDRRSTDSDVFGMEGVDFINLGATEYESDDNNDTATEQSISSDDEELDSIYNLITPVALMQ